jgi:AAA15 family ATPase/GTPase
MESKHLTYFKVENFKRFKSLEIENIGQFNLIVGDNNVGKTSLLEAFLFDEDINEIIKNLKVVLLWRNFQFKEEIIKSINFFDSFFNNINKPINYILGNKGSNKELQFDVVETSTLTKEELDDLNLKNIGNLPSQFSVSLREKNSEKRFFEFINSNKYSNAYTPFIKYNLAYGEDLLNFYSQVRSSKQAKSNLIKNLRLLIPNIENIEPDGSDTNISSQFVITIENIDKTQYLNQFGDGAIKFLRYLLEISVTSNKKLMIDEIDTGIHYSRMKEFWKIILQAAKENNVQLHTTTHSKECIESFTKALEETGLQKEGRIIRLAETKNGIKAFTMEFEEFENALIAESEIR